MFVGDIRPKREYPPNTPLSEITDFEIWDGQRWVDAKDARGQRYVVGRLTDG